MLTWQAGKVFKFDNVDITVDENIKLNEPEVLELPKFAKGLKGPKIKAGWSLTHDKDGMVYLDDGSSHIFTVDPSTWKVTHSCTVMYQGTPIKSLNELEAVGDKWLFANVFLTSDVL